MGSNTYWGGLLAYFKIQHQAQWVRGHSPESPRLLATDFYRGIQSERYVYSDWRFLRTLFFLGVQAGPLLKSDKRTIKQLVMQPRGWRGQGLQIGGLGRGNQREGGLERIAKNSDASILGSAAQAPPIRTETRGAHPAFMLELQKLDALLQIEDVGVVVVTSRAEPISIRADASRRNLGRMLKSMDLNFAVEVMDANTLVV